MKVYRIDEQGFYIEDVILEHEGELTSNMITVDYIEGLYKPKWDGEKWVEGLTQQELEVIEEQKLLNSLLPTQEEIAKAELEIKILTLLEEVLS